MQAYKVEERFPHDKYLNRGEITVTMLNESFFDILLCLNGTTTREVEAITKGDMKIYLFEAFPDIPFIILDFGNGFNLDVSLDVTKITGEQAQKWLTSEANVINIFLVEAQTGVLKGMRMISINFADEIRAILKRQIGHIDVQSYIDAATSKYTTKDMIRLSTKYMKFQR